MKASVIGAGFVGLVTGACLAEKGHQVTCLDTDASKVNKINRGESPIFEKGLDELLRKHIGARLTATVDAQAAIQGSEITLIAVGTPFDGTRLDLGYVKEAARTVGSLLAAKSDYHVVVVKSTVVPGTTDNVVLPILETSSGKRAGRDFGVGMNPEFLTEGEAVSDFMFPDRIICGGMDVRTQEALEALYAPFAGAPSMRTNNGTAELIKYASNALLATLISFSNELANLGAVLGNIDIVEVMNGLHSSRYLRLMQPDGRAVDAPINSFLMAGCGFGGSCLPKDVNALISCGQGVGLPMNLLQSVIGINKQQPAQVFRLLAKHFASLEGKKVTVLGLAFRPDTNDMRESPAIPIIRRLLAECAQVSVYDPVAMHEARTIFGEEIRYCESLEDALSHTEAVVLVTRWKEFEGVPDALRRLGSTPVFVDGRRMLDKSHITNYEGIGL